MWRLPASVLAVLLSLRFCPVAQAANPAISAAETSAQFGLTAGYTGYEENITPQDTENGALLGFHAGLSALRPAGVGGIGLPDLYTGIEYDFSAGFLNYNGNLQTSRHPPYHAADTDYYNSAIVRLGLGRAINAGTELIPYVAGGYQNWYRNIGGPGGYNELYQSGLIGGGLKLDFATSPMLVLSLSAESLAVIGAGISVPSQNFSGSFGISAQERVSLDADYRLTSAWHAFAGLGISHGEYTGSKSNNAGIYEPLSTTFQIKSLVGVAYGF